jgi:hypothetical protein
LTDPSTTSPEIKPRRSPWRRFVMWGIPAVLVGVFFAECARLGPTEAAILPSGERIEVIQLTRYKDIQLRMPGGPRTLQGILIDYYPLAVGRDSLPAEADRVSVLARSAAERGGDSLIIVRQSVPFISRFLWFDRRYDYYFRRDSTGVWLRFRP